MAPVVVGKVDITPSWAALMPWLLDVMETGTPEARSAVRTELMRLAVALDKHQEAGHGS